MGAPRIDGELKMLGFDISERTVLRWMRKAPRSPEPAKRWVAFLSNHREAIAAMDFFTVPALTFGVLYCFFVIAHDRRRILHCNVTRWPTSAWIVQQLREAFPYDSTLRYLILDRGSNFNEEVIFVHVEYWKSGNGSVQSRQAARQQLPREFNATANQANAALIDLNNFSARFGWHPASGVPILPFLLTLCKSMTHSLPLVPSLRPAQPSLTGDASLPRSGAKLLHRAAETAPHPASTFCRGRFFIMHRRF